MYQPILHIKVYKVQITNAQKERFEFILSGSALIPVNLQQK